MKRIYLIVISLLAAFNLFSQVAPGKYFVEFTDKNNNPYSLDKPSEFLSGRAIQRRQNQWIGIDSTDLPLTPSYVGSIRELGITIITQSKWLNGIIIDLPDSTLLDTIRKFPFVKKVSLQLKQFISLEGPDKKFSFETGTYETIDYKLSFNGFSEGSALFNYGPSFTQIHMVNGDLLHQQNYRGQGKVIAVLDAGFYNVDILPVFDSIRNNNQILGTRDFVLPGNNVYKEHPHGMEVLSIIGGNWPGQLIGTAPKASFWLFRTEDTDSEFIIEEYNWISAAEVADSAGADIITSSLGYTVFDNPAQDHTCADMDGNTTTVSRGANIAAGKGIVVVSSAGNSGGTSWHCMSAPADGLGVLGIGAVDSLGKHASFSSVGEVTSRVKPNVVAMGQKTVIAAADGTIMRGSGTSFSAPVIAGMMACLWQAVPSASNYALMRATELSGSRIENPDSLVGYGIPDFNKAISLVGVDPVSPAITPSISPNPFLTGFTVTIHSSTSHILTITIQDITGRIIITEKNFFCRIGENLIQIDEPILSALKPGIYFVKVATETWAQVYPIVKSSN
jgi:serine protease AprX